MAVIEIDSILITHTGRVKKIVLQNNIFKKVFYIFKTHSG